SAALMFPSTPVGDVMGGLAGLMGVQDLPKFFAISIGILVIAAVASATYDIVGDGLYMIALRDGQQAFFVGLRSTFWRLAMIGAGRFLPILAGTIQEHTGPDAQIVTIRAEPGATLGEYPFDLAA